jgi:glycosyltransferase involved in cell wall biosynthesis
MSSEAQGGHGPAVSIVIPFYNPGGFFVLALKSVFAQSFQDWELLLIDDGGTDDSKAMVSRLNDPRVRAIADGANRGLSYRLNQGAELARGEYLFRMDADDAMHPDRVARQLAVLRASEKNTVVGTASYTIDADSRVVGWRPANPGKGTGFAARHSFVHPTVAATASWFRANPYSTDDVYRRGEDAELWCRTAASTEFKWIEEPLLFYREVGVFSIGPYLAGQLAVLDLIRRLEKSPARRMWLAAKERAKMGLFWSLAALHLNDLAVRHRYRRLPEEDRNEAQRVMQQVIETELPLEPGE